MPKLGRKISRAHRPRTPEQNERELHNLVWRKLDKKVPHDTMFESNFNGERYQFYCIRDFHEKIPDTHFHISITKYVMDIEIEQDRTILIKHKNGSYTVQDINKAPISAEKITSLLSFLTIAETQSPEDVYR